MLLAVDALDVAFVTAVAALTTALVVPLSSWLIAKQARDHELALERERRLFDARRTMYESILEDIFKSVASMHHAHVTVVGVEGYTAEPHLPTGLGMDEYLELQGRLSVVASDEVLAALQAFAEPTFAFWAIILRLDKDDSPPPTEEDKADLSGLRKEAIQRRDDLASEMRKDLAGRR